MNGREMSRQLNKCNPNAQTQVRQPNEQMVKSTGRRSLPRQQNYFKQQRQQHLIFNLRISRESGSTQFLIAILIEISQTKYGRQRQNLKKINKNKNRPLYVSLSVKYGECCFVTFCKHGQRNEQRIITHAYTAIVLVAVAVKGCLIKLLKTE